jgi:hypothetical protein
VRGALGALVAFALCAVLGGALAVHRAVLGGILAAVRRHSLGQRAAALLLDRVMGLAVDGTVRAEGAAGARGRAVAAALDRVPLAQAEAWLRQAVSERLGAAQGGALRQRAERKVLDLVESVTLARLRDEGRAAGSVDLPRLRDELGARADDAVARLAVGTMTRLTVFIVLGACGGSLLAASLLRQLPL